MRIQHNIMAMNAYRNYTSNVSAMKKNLEKLSSGYKINRAGDDAAGLAISEKMRAQIKGLQTAQKNAKDGISLVQTAEGALTEVHDMLNRMVELATQSANGTYDNTTDRNQMQKEVDQLLSEINRIADSSNFNGIKLLDGSLGLNKEAVTAITGLDAAAKGADTVWTATATAAANKITVTGVHGVAGAAKAVPEFVIDLKDVKFETAASNAEFEVKFAGATLTGTATNTTTKATVTASKMATALIGKYAGGTSGATAAKLVKFGTGSNAIYFKAEAVTGQSTQIKFSYVGVGGITDGKITTDTVTSTKGDAITAGAANAFNSAIKGAAVSINAKTGEGSMVTGDHIVHGVVYKAAAAKTAATPFGATFELTAGMVASGNTIKIDDKTWTIAYSSTATSAISSTTITINTKKASTDALKMKEVSRLLAGQTTTNYKITSNGSETFHIDQLAGTPGSTAPKTQDDVKKAVTITKAGPAAKNAGVKLTIAADKFKEGDVITIGNGTAAKKFVYSATKTGSVAEGANKGAKYFKDISSLKTAIGNTYNVATTASTIELRVKNAADKVPMILGRGLTLQIGDTSESFNQLNVGVQDMHANSLGIGGLKIDTEVDAQAAIQKIKDAINTVSDVRGTLGATQNRLDHTINNLSVMTENIQDAESSIRDTDVANEMMAYTKNNILIQSAQAMLAQANQVPQGVLQLLQ